MVTELRVSLHPLGRRFWGAVHERMTAPPFPFVALNRLGRNGGNDVSLKSPRPHSQFDYGGLRNARGISASH